MILMEIDPQTGSIGKSYIHGSAQIFAQHDGGRTADRYFYLHDRLGSVRQVINSSGSVVNFYTYEPFGKCFATECTALRARKTTENPFKFTGQYLDAETGEYHLRASSLGDISVGDNPLWDMQYNPTLARFTARDPVFGKLEQPITLHKYHYCSNDSVNRVDLTGKWAVTSGTTIHVAGGKGGAQISVQYFYGMSDDLTFFTGYMLTVGGSLELTQSEGMSISAHYTMGYSPNAQSPEDFRGFFVEGGGSAGFGFSAGGSYAWSPATNVQLRTVAMGGGFGGSMYAHGTWTWVYSDFSIGPSMHTRTRSPFEQRLTNMQDWFDNRLIGLVR
ncbi:MAG: RHS repeat-associated core domain-containing protein [Sedimentisphaerales bacterium]|nr:RHS repeat-associated core domain-containing protein [Sedimentisphaerales bacterium]